MPELPEVETIARRLAPLIEGRVIGSVRRLDPRIAAPAGSPGRAAGMGRASAAALLKGRRIERVGRRGKALVLELRPAGALVFRLGMTGHVGLAGKGERPSPLHLHAVFALSGGASLFYNDSRRFGRILVDPSRTDPSLGIAADPLSPRFEWRALADRAGRSRRAVK